MVDRSEEDSTVRKSPDEVRSCRPSEGEKASDLLRPDRMRSSSLDNRLGVLNIGDRLRLDDLSDREDSNRDLLLQLPSDLRRGSPELVLKGDIPGSDDPLSSLSDLSSEIVEESHLRARDYLPESDREIGRPRLRGSVKPVRVRRGDKEIDDIDPDSTSFEELHRIEESHRDSLPGDIRYPSRESAILSGCTRSDEFGSESLNRPDPGVGRESSGEPGNRERIFGSGILRHVLTAGPGSSVEPEKPASGEPVGRRIEDLPVDIDRADRYHVVTEPYPREPVTAAGVVVAMAERATGPEYDVAEPGKLLAG
jgi:hypothetical protein